MSIVAVGLGIAFAVALGGCASGSSSGGGAFDASTGDAASSEEAPGSALLPPGSSCKVLTDSGTSLRNGVCARNPALPTCRQCLEFKGGAGNSDDQGLCEYGCRLSQNDCPTGQTCEPFPSGSYDIGGCSPYKENGRYTIGYCR